MPKPAPPFPAVYGNTCFKPHTAWHAEAKNTMLNSTCGLTSAMTACYPHLHAAAVNAPSHNEMGSLHRLVQVLQHMPHAHAQLAGTGWPSYQARSHDGVVCIMKHRLGALAIMSKDLMWCFGHDRGYSNMHYSFFVLLSHSYFFTVIAPHAPSPGWHACGYQHSTAVAMASCPHDCSFY